MNLAQIKEKTGIPQFNLNQSTDIDGNPAVTTNADGTKTTWFRHWDDDNRVAVSIAEDLLTELKSNANIDSLGLQHEERTGSKGKYQSFRIVKYAPAQHTL